ncbi:ELKS/Rab6-interacting/CAST family member 1-like [Diaphorina citri]|uniref:ELKS/Rab6-interacting/CAST family member 1-like n=1 Tax=Diaphorina citri TaxID=121845 RepID=A0A3Q0J1K3_DIACI|nr:ELKS/Rab6-interacting/CAST family member 1-like [Diaphorina citri]
MEHPPPSRKSCIRAYSPVYVAREVLANVVSLNDIYWDEEPSDNASGVIKETNQTNLGTLPGVKIDINKPVETVEKAVMTDNILEENTSLEERQKVASGVIKETNQTDLGTLPGVKIDINKPVETVEKAIMTDNILEETTSLEERQKAFTNKKLLVETSDKAIMTDTIQEETKTLENRDKTITDQRQKGIDKEMIGEIFTDKTVKEKDNNSSMTSRTQERGEGLEETPKAITNKAMQKLENLDKGSDEAMAKKAIQSRERNKGLEETPTAIINKAIEEGDKANDEAMDEKELDELEQLIDLMNEKNERIEELEMALKESVQMMAEKEKELDEEEERRKAIMEKVQLLEHKLLTVQTAQAVRCASCKPLLSRLHTLEVQCERLMEERLMGALDVANGNGPFQDYSDQGQ